MRKFRANQSAYAWLRTSWKPHQTQRASLKEVTHWLHAGHGLGVVLGSVSDDWVCRDFDDAESYQRWIEAFSVHAGQLPVVQTSRGFHVFAKIIEASKTKTFKDGELRGEGSYVVLPPSRHQSGSYYQWIREPQLMEAERLDVLGLDQPFVELLQVSDCCVATESSQSTEMASVDSVHSVVCVDSVTPDQHEKISEAIGETIPAGYGHRNDGIFRFSRKMIGILNGKPNSRIVELYGLRWFEAARGKIKTLDAMVTVADLQHAIECVRVADDGSDVILTAWTESQELPKPWFVANCPDDSSGVRLAKLIVRLDVLFDGGEWFLSCRKAPKLMNIPHMKANRLLNYWVTSSVLEITKPGQPGLPGSPATRYRLRQKLSGV